NIKDGHGDEVIELVFSADGNCMASGAADGFVRLWDTRSGRPLDVWRKDLPRAIRPGMLAEKGGVNALDMTADGRWIISAGSSYILRVWDATSGKQHANIFYLNPEPGRPFSPGHVYKVRISPDGSKAVGFLMTTDSGSNLVATWDLKKG